MPKIDLQKLLLRSLVDDQPANGVTDPPANDNAPRPTPVSRPLAAPRVRPAARPVRTNRALRPRRRS